MDRSLNDEFAACVASARALVAEFVEEGIEQFAQLSDAEFVARPQPPESTLSSTPAALPVSAERTPPSPPAANEAAPALPLSLEQVRSELGECTRCRLCEGRNQIVFGDGNPDAALMFIGEGPGEEEDRRGAPFVGRAGEMLTQMIESGLAIPRSQVYICNIIKCRPPKNRDPKPDEMAACRPFLDGQIDAVRPKVIVTLGRPATSLLLGRGVAITRIRGTWQTYRGIPLMPTFHPAYLLRQYTLENRRCVWKDLKAALARSRE